MRLVTIATVQPNNAIKIRIPSMLLHFVPSISSVITFKIWQSEELFYCNVFFFFLSEKKPRNSVQNCRSKTRLFFRLRIIFLPVNLLHIYMECRTFSERNLDPVGALREAFFFIFVIVFLKIEKKPGTKKTRKIYSDNY